jgi:hypothetical protein
MKNKFSESGNYRQQEYWKVDSVGSRMNIQLVKYKTTDSVWNFLSSVWPKND